MPSDTLSPAEHYREHGFLVVAGLVPSAELERLRRRTSEIARGQVRGYSNSDIELEPANSASQTANRQSELPAVRKLNRCAENDPMFLEHARQPRILDIVELLIGPDIKLFDSQCFMKPPGGVEKPYHQDSAYFAIEPMDLVTCWTALDDVTIENGPVSVIPGSHLLGLLDHSAEWFVGDRPDKQVPDDLLNREAETTIIMSAGSCSFHHSLLLHRSSANRSSRSRRGLAVHYMSARCRWTHPNRSQPGYMLLRGREYDGCV